MQRIDSVSNAGVAMDPIYIFILGVIVGYIFAG